MYDALGRRVEFAHDGLGKTTDYYYDGVNEVVETPGGSTSVAKYYVHGVSYVDERLFMYNDDLKQPYYYALERMYSVWAMIDRTGAIVERVMYDGYGRPYIRESAGLGDMNNDSVLDSTDATRVAAAIAGTIWDPRADVNGDGVVDGKDQDSYDEKEPVWQDWPGNDLVVAQTFSDVDNWYLFQGVPHVALDASNSVTDKAPLNHHRARYADPAIGRWGTRDPLQYMLGHESWNIRFIRALPARLHTPESKPQGASLHMLLSGNPNSRADSLGLLDECVDFCGRQIWDPDSTTWGPWGMTYCCEDAAGECSHYICYNPGVNTSACPGACIKAHEEARARTIGCTWSLHSCGCKSKLTSFSQIDCDAYRAQRDCFRSTCLLYVPQPGYLAYLDCMVSHVCDQGQSLSGNPDAATIVNTCIDESGWHGGI